MARIAFKMKLHPGRELEYKKRHDALWPDLHELLKATGVSNYSIFLDESTNDLFAVMEILEPSALEELPNHPVMKKWWAYMKDIMDTHEDRSPVSIPLKEVFFLP